MRLHLDTCFAVDYLREDRQQKAGPAHDFVAQFPQAELRMSVFVACELFHGAERSARRDEEIAAIEGLTRVVPILQTAPGLHRLYGSIYSSLQRQGRGIATMDLLIATSALLDEVSLVTRNRKHFEVVPGLRIVSY